LTSVLERLVATVIHLAERYVAFCLTLDKLYNKSSGNFLGQMKLMAKFWLRNLKRRGPGSDG
jgi:hypothetical protein